MNYKAAKEILCNAQLAPEVLQAVEVILDTSARFQRALALASRYIDTGDDCPFCNVLPNMQVWKECGRSVCGHIGPECWQRYFRERSRSEQVCRVCGYTDDSEALKSEWVEDDLCNRCAERAK